MAGRALDTLERQLEYQLRFHHTDWTVAVQGIASDEGVYLADLCIHPNMELYAGSAGDVQSPITVQVRERRA